MLNDEKYALEKSSFHVMIAPLVQALPPWGRGRIAMPWHYLN
jgi:hypothetical protein